MAESSFYVTKTVLDGVEEVKVDGRSVLDAWPALQAALISRCGREVAALFAEPVVTRGNGAVLTSVSWYAASDAEPARLSSLDPDARHAAEAALRTQLAEVIRLLDDPELGPLLGGALQIASTDGLWALDGRPLIADWGLLPIAANRTAQARDEHFRRTLGPYLPFSRAPAISSADWLERHGGARPASPPPAAPVAAAVPPAGGTAGTAAGAGAAASAVGGVPAAVVPGGTVTIVERPSWSWIPLLVAVILLALALVYVLLPGVLLYPPRPVVAQNQGSAQDLELLRGNNEALKERIERLKGAVSRNVCTAESDILPPGPPPMPGPGGTPPTTAEGRPPGGPEGPQRAEPERPLVPPPPSALAAPPTTRPDQPPFEGSLVDLLENATALVIAQGDQSGIGSGFFVAPKILVTNLHVVEKANPDGLYVTSKALGGAQPAKLLHRTPTSEIGQPDFAVLEVPAAASLPTLALSDKLAKLDHVVAGGFPGIILDTDVNFQALKAGDTNAIPEMAVTEGVVTVIQRRGDGPPLIIHTAMLSPGNSGGPLIDSCGRVVGINTFIRSENVPHTLNYSLQAPSVADFLAAKGVPFQRVEDACRPQLAAAPAAPGGTPPTVGAPPTGPTPPTDTPPDAIPPPPPLPQDAVPPSAPTDPGALPTANPPPAPPALDAPPADLPPDPAPGGATPPEAPATPQ